MNSSFPRPSEQSQILAEENEQEQSELIIRAQSASAEAIRQEVGNRDEERTEKYLSQDAKESEQKMQSREQSLSQGCMNRQEEKILQPTPIATKQDERRSSEEQWLQSVHTESHCQDAYRDDCHSEVYLVLKTFSQKEIQQRAGGTILCMLGMQNEQRGEAQPLDMEETCRRGAQNEEELVRLNAQNDVLVKQLQKSKDREKELNRYISQFKAAYLSNKQARKKELGQSIFLLMEQIGKMRQQSKKESQKANEAILRNNEAQSQKVVAFIQDLISIKDKNHEEAMRHLQNENTLKLRLKEMEISCSSLQIQNKSLKQLLEQKAQQKQSLRAQRDKLEQSSMEWMQQNQKLNQRIQHVDYTLQKANIKYRQIQFILQKKQKEVEQWRNKFNRKVQDLEQLKILVKEGDQLLIAAQQQHQSALKEIIDKFKQDYVQQLAKQAQDHSVSLAALKRQHSDLQAKSKQLQRKYTEQLREQQRISQQRQQKDQESLANLRTQNKSLDQEKKKIWREASRIISDLQESLAQLAIQHSELFIASNQKLQLLQIEKDQLLQQTALLIQEFGKQSENHKKEQMESLQSQLKLQFQKEWLSRELAQLKEQKSQPILIQSFDSQPAVTYFNDADAIKTGIDAVSPVSEELLMMRKKLEQLKERQELRVKNLSALFKQSSLINDKLICQLMEALQLERDGNEKLRRQIKRVEAYYVERCEDYERVIECYKEDVDEKNDQLMKLGLKVKRFEQTWLLIQDIQFKLEMGASNSLQQTIKLFRQNDIERLFHPLIEFFGTVAYKQLSQLSQKNNNLEFLIRHKQELNQKLSRQRSQFQAKSEILQQNVVFSKKFEEWCRSEIFDPSLPIAQQINKDQEYPEIKQQSPQRQSTIFEARQLHEYLFWDSIILSYRRQDIKFLLQCIEEHAGKKVISCQSQRQLFPMKPQILELIDKTNIVWVFKAAANIFCAVSINDKTQKGHSVILLSLTTGRVVYPSRKNSVSPIRSDQLALVLGNNEAKFIWKSKVFIISEVSKIRYFDDSVSLEQAITGTTGTKRLQVEEIQMFRLSLTE